MCAFLERLYYIKNKFLKFVSYELEGSTSLHKTLKLMPKNASVSYYRMYNASYDEHSDKLLLTYFDTSYHIQIRKVFSSVQQKMIVEKVSRTVLELRIMTAKINSEKRYWVQNE